MYMHLASRVLLFIWTKNRSALGLAQQAFIGVCVRHNSQGRITMFCIIDTECEFVDLTEKTVAVCSEKIWLI